MGLLSYLETTAAIVDDDRHWELRATGTHDLLEMLSSRDCQLNWTVLGNCFTVEIWVERLGFDTYDAT